MARKRDPRRDEAVEIYEESNGEITNRKIAEMLDVPEKTISAWKSRDKWNVVLQTNECSTTKEKPTKKTKTYTSKTTNVDVVENDELSDKQWLFVGFYVKYWNATKAYQKAYQSTYDVANAEGYKLLVNPCIKAEIIRARDGVVDESLLSFKAVLQKYMDIAFADITDFVEFGREKVTDINPITGDEVEYEVNRVKFKESTEVDGTLITEVKQGKDGVAVKLADKMKALEMLAKYTDLLSENERKQLQNEKLRADIMKSKGGGNKEKENEIVALLKQFGGDDD